MPIKVPETQELRGEEAIKALSNAIAEIEKQRGNQLADKKARALIKIARGMICSIEVTQERTKQEKRRASLPFSRIKTLLPKRKP